MNTLLATALGLALFTATAHAASPAARSAPATMPTTPVDLSAGLAPNRWRGAPDIEGVWEEQVAQVDCADGSVLRSFRAINTFGSGGSLIAINSSPPPLAAPALGSWWRVSRHGDFGAKMKFFRYNPDGSFAGSQEVTRTMLLDMDGETLTGDITFEVFDANDQVIATGCARETGLRFR
jgi:hypothetical protein